MLGKMFKNQKVLYFVAGAVSAIFGVKLLKSETSRKLCVKGLAQGIRMQKDIQEAFYNIKEEASDICYDAKEKSDTEE